jgi:hypothetical protein
MNDFAFIAIMLVFFALATLFVAACDRIIGQDEDAVSLSPEPDAEQEASAA